MQITKSDVLWNYGATFLKIASFALLLPFILKMMPSEMIGIWSIFMTITAFASLLDFGFNPSFTRNVTYVFSGVRSLKTKGHEAVNAETQGVDFGLLKGLISSMRRFYSCMAIVVFIILSTLGTFYISRLLNNYKESHTDVYVAWSLLCIINVYNLYTFYYDSLLEGKGLIKRSKQIIIIGQSIYIIIATILILNNFGLIAIVSAQASSVIVIRILSHRSFFTPSLKKALKDVIPRPRQEIFRAVYPNALKIGLASLGAFMVTRSAIIIGSLYLSLEEIGSYGVTIQLIRIIISLAGIYTSTYQPKIVQLRVGHKPKEIKELYLKGQIILFLTFILGGACLLILGTWGLHFIGSKTKLMPFTITILAIIVALEETNLSIAASILLTKNEVPFFRASLISGAFIILGLYLGLNFMNLGLLGLVLIPLIIDTAYQAWKWPWEVAKDLDLTYSDMFKPISKYLLNAKFHYAQNRNKAFKNKS
ncbi:MAG: O-unit flippase-like protein [Ferruginibacter sp.]